MNYYGGSHKPSSELLRAHRTAVKSNADNPTRESTAVQAERIAIAAKAAESIVPVDQDEEPAALESFITIRNGMECARARNADGTGWWDE